MEHSSFDIKAIAPEFGTADAAELYHLSRWSDGYFDISPRGHAVVHPRRRPDQTIDLKVLVDELQARGIQLPILLRFSDILEGRLVEIHESFARAIREYEYGAPYRGVFPIKVNEQRHVVESILQAGKPYHFGLEAGSKPELLAVLGLIDDPEALVICNGYKDEEFIELALMGDKAGQHVVQVVEKYSELPMILDCAERLGVRPRLGVRVRLSSKGAGRWHESGGDRSKFGLDGARLLHMATLLRERGMLDCLELLHFHLGSQVCSIEPLRAGLREASRFYVELVRFGAGLRYLDVGGGLAVDYDGSRSESASSTNYGVQEYANTVVWEILSALEGSGVEHPTIISESGRALTAHHSVLLTNVLSASEVQPDPIELDFTEAPAPIRELMHVQRNLSSRNVQESYHDCRHLRSQVLERFSLGLVTLEMRAFAESCYWGTMRKIGDIVKTLDFVPEEFCDLERDLSDIYFLNMSVFQSLPDSWAIDQVFPVMPIHRLEERPTRLAVLADITCDSDGKIDRFVAQEDTDSTLALHALRPSEQYILGVFLVGAYQEILGDLHNLFGDNNVVHVSWCVEQGAYRIDHVEDGDTVNEVLGYVQHSRDHLVGEMRRKVEVALRNGRMSIEDARRVIDMYRAGFDGYTYLEV